MYLGGVQYLNFKQQNASLFQNNLRFEIGLQLRIPTQSDQIGVAAIIFYRTRAGSSGLSPIDCSLGFPAVA